MLTFYSHDNRDVVWHSNEMNGPTFRWFLNVMLDEDYGDRQTYLNCDNEDEVRNDIDAYIDSFIENIEYEGGLAVVNHQTGEERVWPFKGTVYLENLFDEHMNNWRKCVENNFSSTIENWMHVYCKF